MPTSTARRKGPRPRVNVAVAMPLPEYAALERAVKLAGVSRNHFIIESSLQRAREILIEHGELDEHDIDAFADDALPAARSA